MRGRKVPGAITPDEYPGFAIVGFGPEAPRFSAGLLSPADSDGASTGQPSPSHESASSTPERAPPASSFPGGPPPPLQLPRNLLSPDANEASRTSAEESVGPPEEHEEAASPGSGGYAAVGAGTRAFTCPCLVVPDDVLICPQWALPLTPPGEVRRKDSVGLCRRRTGGDLLHLETADGAAGMEPVVHTCVVCGATNTAGLQRRSGWKCTGCIGHRHTLDASWPYSLMPSYVPKGAPMPPATPEERRYREFVRLERRRRRRRLYPSAAADGPQRVSGATPSSCRIPELAAAPPPAVRKAVSPARVLVAMLSHAVDPTCVLFLLTVAFVTWVAAHALQFPVRALPGAVLP
eukprot:TRINITY_DN475_c1_g2_i2.p1 TRINITY_DN475_c1_g2~~TRINITY_DN475_c1_g2_i2.p1  ORF type:complete len:398 (+),score=111.19 TRINITY_DN475_c1_g2_i2:150-1196(+)